MIKLLKMVRRKLIKRYYLYMAIKQKGNVIVSPTSIIDKNANIYADGEFLKVGDNSVLHPFSFIRLCGGSVEIGNNTYINPYTVIYGHGGTKIGNNVLIASHCTIIPSNHVFENPNKTIIEQGEISKGIVIGDDVWLGTGVKVLDGVSIGKGSVVGANSVVTKDIPPYSVAVGSPARVIKERR